MKSRDNFIDFLKSNKGQVALKAIDSFSKKYSARQKFENGSVQDSKKITIRDAGKEYIVFYVTSEVFLETPNQGMKPTTMWHIHSVLDGNTHKLVTDEKAMNKINEHIELQIQNRVAKG